MEKEAQKSKARKSRDAFLIMLAENTGIDARTRWREAVQLLQDDIRFTNVEESNEREDLFNDFVSELEKKEREDRLKQKDGAINYLILLLRNQEENGILTRRSTWIDERDNYLKKTELRSLEDIEVRRYFQDCVGRLDAQYKDMERNRKLELQKKIDNFSSGFRDLLEKLAFEGKINARSRWLETCQKDEVLNSSVYRELDNLFVPEKKEGGSWTGSGSGSGVGSHSSSSSVSMNGNESHGLSSGSNSGSGSGGGSGSNSGSVSGGSGSGSARDTFDRVLVLIREAARADKRLILEVLKDMHYELKHTSTLNEFKDAVYIAAGVDVKPKGTSTSTSTSSIDLFSSVTTTETVSITEEGEELEENVDDRTKSGFGKQLRYMLAKRPFAVEGAYTDLIEEEIRRHKKREDRFLILLEEYSLEHSSSSVDEIKRNLSRHPDYIDLNKSDRDKLISTFISTRVEVKSKRKNDDKNDKNEKNEKISRSNEGRNGRDGVIDKEIKIIDDKNSKGRKDKEINFDKRSREGRESRDRRLSEGEILPECVNNKNDIISKNNSEDSELNGNNVKNGTDSSSVISNNHLTGDLKTENENVSINEIDKSRNIFDVDQNIGENVDKNVDKNLIKNENHENNVGENLENFDKNGHHNSIENINENIENKIEENNTDTILVNTINNLDNMSNDKKRIRNDNKNTQIYEEGEEGEEGEDGEEKEAVVETIDGESLKKRKIEK